MPFLSKLAVWAGRRIAWQCCVGYAISPMILPLHDVQADPKRQYPHGKSRNSTFVAYVGVRDKARSRSIRALFASKVLLKLLLVVMLLMQ